MKTQYKKLSLEFPADEYVYLKMTCVQKNMTIKDFVTQSVKRSIEDFKNVIETNAEEV